MKHNKSARKRPLPGVPIVEISGNIDQCIHVQGSRWVAYKIHGLYGSGTWCPTSSLK
jgi:hypothetical protein